MGGLAEERLRMAMRALVDRDHELLVEVIGGDSRVDELQIEIDDRCFTLLALHQPVAVDLRLLLAAMRMNSDFERIGDIAVNLAERVVSLREMPDAKPPEELAPMAEAVRAMVSRSLGSLIFRNAEMAAQVLESDDVVDQYRDRIFENLLLHMTQNVALVTPGMQFVLATRHLERIADHATNIAEDIIFWVRGLDVRHGRGLTVRPESEMTTMGLSSEVTENSHGLHADVTPGCDTQHV